MAIETDAGKMTWSHYLWRLCMRYGLSEKTWNALVWWYLGI